MRKIRMFDSCGSARDPFVVVPKLFELEKFENPFYQPLWDILRPKKSYPESRPSTT